MTQALVADLAYFYRHAVPDPPRFSLLGGGANTGVADAARGVVDAGMLARNLGPDDPPELVFTPIALSALCMITNPSNPVPDFSRALIQQIFTGQVTSWSQVPGSKRTDAIVTAGVILSSAASVYWASVFLDAGTRITYAPATLHLDRADPRLRGRDPGRVELRRPDRDRRRQRRRLPGRAAAPARRSATAPTCRGARSASSPAGSRAATSSASCAGSRRAPRRARSSPRATSRSRAVIWHRFMCCSVTRNAAIMGVCPSPVLTVPPIDAPPPCRRSLLAQKTSSRMVSSWPQG